MKRWLVRIPVFLLLGAIVNAAVAWGCVLVDLQVSDVVLESPTITWPEWLESSKWDVETFPLEKAVSYLPGVRLEQFWVWRARGSTGYNIAGEMRAGFPMLSLIGWFSPNCNGPVQWDPSQPPWDSVGFWAYDERYPHTTLGKVLPLIPIWPGFAINTVFYGLILWMLFAGPFVVRRWRRIRRGLCPKCAYDLRGSVGETCPECGTAISLSFAAARERVGVREPTA